MAEKHKINLKTTRKNKTTTKREKNKILKTKSIQREEKSRHQQQQQQGNGRHYKEQALTPVSTEDKSTTASAILQRKRVGREAPMNLDQQKPPQTRDLGAQRH